jgi:methionine synthase I (cobalamin-dependent)
MKPVRADRARKEGRSTDGPTALKGRPLRSRILDQIEQTPLILDAAMGTRLVAAGLDLKKEDTSLWCLSHPEQVEAIHASDVAAGAGGVLTNTFGANRCLLARFGKPPLVESINRRAVQLARSAAGPDRFVLGSIGPTAQVERGAAAEQAVILADQGVDAVILETFTFREALPVLAEVVASVGGEVPVFVSLWKWSKFPTRAVRRLLDAGAAVLGLNCQPGAGAAVQFAEALASSSNVPLLVKPGVGLKADEAMSPEALAEVVPKLLANRVRLIGGCCGTTERHIAALAACTSIHRVSFGNTAGDTAS